MEGLDDLLEFMIPDKNNESCVCFPVAHGVIRQFWGEMVKLYVQYWLSGFSSWRRFVRPETSVTFEPKIETNRGQGRTPSIVQFANNHLV